MRSIGSWVSELCTADIRAARLSALLARALIALTVLVLAGWAQGCTLGSQSGTDSASADTGRFPIMRDGFDPWRLDVEGWLLERSLAQRSEADIALNLPFQVMADSAVPYRGRFLLLHGLNDSPYVWRDFADELSARGYDVRALLFEGHGTTPVDMLEVRWESWLAAARRHLQEWSGDDVPMSLGGFSMGGAIATMLAMENPDIESLLLVSPAFDSRLNHMLRFSGIYKLFRPWIFGGMILEDNPMKYNSIPVNSGWQFYELTKELKRRWTRTTRIHVPTLMVFSVDDSVVDVEYSAKLFRRRFTHPQRQLIVYEAASQLEGTKTRPVDGWPRLTDSSRPMEQTRDAFAPEHRILNQSHLGTMYSPGNPLFGKAGRVLVCNGNEYPVFMACMRSQRHWYGAQHTVSPDGVPLARTTWNPDWSHLLESFDHVNQINSSR